MHCYTTFRGFLSEQDEQVKAFAENTEALQDMPPGEAREAILADHWRVVYVAN